MGVLDINISMAFHMFFLLRLLLSKWSKWGEWIMIKWIVAGLCHPCC